MWRWIRNALIVFSLVVWVAGSAMWVRSFWRTDYIKLEHGHDVEHYGIGSHGQRFYFGWYWNSRYTYKEREWKWEVRSLEVEPYDRGLRDFRDESTVIEFAGFEWFWRTTSTPGKNWRAAFIPYWLIVPTAAALPLWWLLRGRRTSKPYRRKHGLCLGCGYDRRATSGACPECGRADVSHGGK